MLCGLSSCSEWRLLSSCGAQASFVAEHRLCGGLRYLWHTGLVAPRHVESSRTRDQTQVPCIWLMDSYPLCQQGSLSPETLLMEMPWICFFDNHLSCLGRQMLPSRHSGNLKSPAEKLTLVKSNSRNHGILVINNPARASICVLQVSSLHLS